MTTRADNVTLLDKDDSHVTEFANGTKFTSVKKGFTTQVVVECPGYATVSYCTNQCKCTINYQDGFQIDCDGHGNYNICNDSTLNLSLLSTGQALYTASSGGTYSFNYSGKDTVLNAIDSLGNTLKVGIHGETEMSMDCDKCVNLHKAFEPRIFVVNADGTGYEALESTTTKEIIGLAESESNSIVLRDIQIPGTRCMSTVVMEPIVLNTDKEVKVDNVVFGVSSPSPQVRHGCFGASTGRGIQISNPLESHRPEELSTSFQFNYRRFLCFEPLSHDKRDIILKAVAKHAEWSEGSTSKHLQELWHQSIESISDFVNYYTTKRTDNTYSQKKVSNLLTMDTLVQKDKEFHEMLDSIREGCVPVYFDSDSEVQKIQQSPALTANLKSQLLDPTIYTTHVESFPTDICQIPLQMDQETKVPTIVLPIVALCFISYIQPITGTSNQQQLQVGDDDDDDVTQQKN